jgi:hypothetical protein
LSQTSSDSASVGADSWLAASFVTRPNAGDYVFNSVTVKTADATGNPGALTVALYSSYKPGTADAFPMNNIGTLSGSLTPATGGFYNYTPGSALTLLPSTIYFVLMLSIPPSAREHSNGRVRIHSRFQRRMVGTHHILAVVWIFFSRTTAEPIGHSQELETLDIARNLPSMPRPFPSHRPLPYWV